MLTVEKVGRGYVHIGLALVLFATFFAYVPALHGGRMWDDEFNLTKPELQSLNGLYRIWFEPEVTADSQYYPLHHTVFWLQHKLWGETYLCYHLVNVFFHSIVVVLLYLLLSKLKVPGAFLAAAIFAVHPVMVESVAIMCEQKNPLSTIFCLVATILYINFDASRGRTAYVFALMFFLMALLTKSVTVTLPPVLLIILWWRRGRLAWRRDLLPMAPFFVLSIAVGLITISVERGYFGPEHADLMLSPAQRMMLAGRAIWFYLGKLVWPNVTFLYPRWNLDPAQWSQWIPSAATVVTTITLWAVRKQWPGVLACWLIYCGTLLPAIGLTNYFMFTNTLVADHIQYAPSMAIISLAAAGIAMGFRHLPHLMVRVGVAACFFWIAALSVASWRQSHLYADPIALYSRTLERNPSSWLAHASLAYELAASGDVPNAIEHYRIAIRLRPIDRVSYNNLGRVLLQTNRSDEAIENFQRALDLRPDFAAAHINLASALIQKGQYQQAIDHCRTAIRTQPTSIDAHLNLSSALLYAGDVEQALEEIRAVHSLNPNDPMVCNTFGAVLLQNEQYAEAAGHIEHALALKPNYAEARNNLAQLFARTGKPQQAIEQFRQAIALDGRLASAHVGLAIVLSAQAKFHEAILHFEKAIQSGADQPDIHNSLGDAYRQSGHADRALEEYQIAVRQKPDFMPACANLAQTLALLNRSKEAVEVAEKAIQTARSTRQQDALGQFEEWLSSYQKELIRANDSQPATPSAAPAR